MKEGDGRLDGFTVIREKSEIKARFVLK